MLNSSLRELKPFIILIPAAGSVTDVEQTLSTLKALHPVGLTETRKAGDAEKLSRAAMRCGWHYIVIAGGDGTLNEVVNGVARANRAARIGVMPLGTGNDFARTLGLPVLIEENLEILGAGKTRAIDIVRVHRRRVRYFVNVAAGGFSAIVRRQITPEIKKSWGPLAYIRGAAAALPKLHAYKIIPRALKFVVKT